MPGPPADTATSGRTTASPATAFGAGAGIGILAGMIGLGGAEFRLPLRDRLATLEREYATLRGELITNARAPSRPTPPMQAGAGPLLTALLDPDHPRP